MEVVLAHINTDFDSLASQFAVTKLIPGVRMVPGHPLEASIRGFLSLYRDLLPLVDLQYVDVSGISHVYIVDCQKLERLEEVARKLITEQHCTYTVFDHHAVDSAGLGSTAREDSIIRPSGSCTTILVDQLRLRGEELTSFEATLLALGIYEDTGSLTYGGTTEADALCVAYLLKHGADLSQVNTFLNPKLDEQQTELFQVLIKNAKVINVEGAKAVISHSRTEQFIEGAAVLARRLMEVNSADVAVVVVYMRDRTYVIGRSDTERISVRDLALEFGGNGHHGAASAVCKDKALEEIFASVQEILFRQARPEITARDIMSSPVRTIKQDVSMEEAARIMLRYGMDGLVVADGDELQGVVSKRDVDKAMHHKLSHAPVRGFMSRPVITINEDTSLSEIQNMMVREDIGRLPVVGRSGSLLGIVSRKEVLDTLYGARRQDDFHNAITANKRHLRVDDKLSRLDESTRWLFTEIGAIADRLNMQAYSVGGVVRDLFLEKDNFDLDFVIEGSAIDLARALEAAYPGRFELVAHHDRFNTATMIFRAGQHREIDLATARIEFYEHPAALPTVEASVLEQDLFRRDFTINALAFCLNPESFGEVIDFYNGLEDLRNKRIRILHSFSFIEDPTRIVRAARFAARFDFELERRTRQQAERAIEMGVFDNLGGFRLKEELRLILDAPSRLRALDLLNEVGGGLRYLASSLEYGEEVRQRLRLAERILAEYPVKDSWIVYLGLLLSPLKLTDVESVMDRLALANDARDWIKQGVTLPVRFSALEKTDTPSNSEIYILMHGHSEQALAIAACVPRAGSQLRRYIKLYLDELRWIKPQVTGTDLLEGGFQRGPEIKEALNMVLKAMLDGKVQSYEEEVSLLAEHYPQYRR